MSLSLAILYTLTCGYLLWRMVVDQRLISTQFGVVGLFSLGYYPLPVLFRPLSSLADIDDDKIFGALLIHYLFLISALLGARAAQRAAGAIAPLHFGWLDALADRRRVPIAFVAFGLYLAYAATAAQTSYAAEDFAAFFEDRSLFFSILAAAAGLCLAFLCMACAMASRRGERRFALILGGFVGVIVLLAIPLGQRLAFISPIIMLFAAMASAGQTGKGLRVLAAGIVVLAIASPFAVYMRGSRHAENGDFLSASEVIGRYHASDDPLTDIFQSLIDRSDLVFNTVYMKDYIDRTDYVGPEYYYSVVVSPIPRFLYPDKPFVLSSNGRADGEISILAWRVMVGGLGSLTAFGGLTAYREGGWIAVILDGLAAGALFAGIARWFGQGGTIARIYYVQFFVLFAVQKAPPCFFEALASFLGQSPVIVLLFLLGKLPLLARGPAPRRSPPTAMARALTARYRG